MSTKPVKYFGATVCLLLLAAIVLPAQGSTTSARAVISPGTSGPTVGHTPPTTKTDSDAAFGSCSSVATANCSSSVCGASAQTTSTVTVIFNQSGGVIISESSGKPNNNEPSQYSGHQFTNTGTASFRDQNVRVVGAGALTQLQLLVDNLVFTIPASGNFDDSINLAFNLDVDQTNLYTGEFEMHGNGDFAGSGVYDAGNWSVALEDDSYVATLTPPPDLLFDVPVNEKFVMDFDSEFSYNGLLHDPDYSNEHSLSIVMPQGFIFVPEPASLSMLLLSGMFVMRRGK